MSHIKVQFSLLKDINLIITTSSKNISEAKDDFKNAISKLDWEVKAQSDISVRAARAVGELRCYNTALNWYSNYLDTAYAKYATLENYKNNLGALDNNSICSAVMGNDQSIIEGIGSVKFYDADKSISGDAFYNLTAQVWEITENSVDKISKVLSFFKRYADTEVADGILGDILGMFVTVSEAYREGISNPLEGLSFVLNYNSDLLSFCTDFMKKVDLKGLDGVSSDLSFISEMYSSIGELSELIATGDLGKALQKSEGFWASIGKVRKEILSATLDDDALKKAVGGTIEPLVAGASTVARFIGDCIELSEDGVYDIHDYSRTLLDSGLAGASSWIKSLTCGLVKIDVDETSDYVMKACNSFHDYMEENNWPTWAKVGGSIIGSPFTFVAGLGNMVVDKVAETPIGNAISEKITEAKIAKIAKNIQL